MAKAGLLKGLGDGLLAISAIRQDNRKAELAQKLEMEREERMANREIDREKRAAEREAGKVVRNKTISKDGVFYEQGFNSSGELVNESIADALAIKRINQEEQDHEIGLQGKLLGIEQAELGLLAGRKNYENMDEDQNLQRRVAESGIAENIAQANRANRPDTPSREEKEKTEEEAILAQARAQLRKPGVTAAMVADHLRKKGYPALAEKIQVTPKE